MGDTEKGKLVRIEKFKVDVREPYMGNIVPLNIEVRTYYRSRHYTNIIVTTMDGLHFHREPYDRVEGLQNLKEGGG